jgi:hypothetical protein
MTHRVTFEVEDGCASMVRVECLVEAGGCHMGCPVGDCDWGHGEDHCEHCDASCACFCALDTESRETRLHRAHVALSPRHECWCEVALAHRDLGRCPHTFADIGQCWLLPWVDSGDGDWLWDDNQIMVPVRMGHEDEHPVEVWTVDYAEIDGEFESWYAPSKPIMETLRRVE